MRQLRYWERLRLVRPQARWGERFYTFGDLAALRSIQRLTQNRIPAGRLRRAISSAEKQFGAQPLPVEQLGLAGHGRQVVVVLPGAGQPYDPLARQWILPFGANGGQANLSAMAGTSAEELFEQALACESSPEYLPQAVENYQRVLEIAPHWIEAHINLGVAFYQMGRLEEAHAEFSAAVQLDPLNGIAQYNLGCILEERGETLAAIEHLRRAAAAMPAHADVHFNLALAYEKNGEPRLAKEQWMLYLRYAPHGYWSDQARAHLRQYASRRKPSPPIPFRRLR